jgi:hypothetical protein
MSSNFFWPGDLIVAARSGIGMNLDGELIGAKVEAPSDHATEKRRAHD